MGCQGKDHQARGIPVQPVHQQCLRKGILHPRQQSVGQVRTLARH
jgi:hypothetical protein